MKAAEARQVLNVEEGADLEAIDEHFVKLFKQNDVEQGGSFYLQSKVVRARERLVEDLIAQGKITAEQAAKGGAKASSSAGDAASAS